MVYFKPWDWIISVSAYREEFHELVNVDDFRESVLSLRFGETGYSYVIDLKGKTHMGTVLLDQPTRGAADPWGIAIGGDGKQLYLTLSGTHELAKVDVVKLEEMIEAEGQQLTNILGSLHRKGAIDASEGFCEQAFEGHALGHLVVDAAVDGHHLVLAGHQRRDGGGNALLAGHRPVGELEFATG